MRAFVFLCFESVASRSASITSRFAKADENLQLDRVPIHLYLRNARERDVVKRVLIAFTTGFDRVSNVLR